MDPGEEILTVAGQDAARRGARGKARWVRARAEDLAAGLGTFTVAPLGQSFLWMDRERVTATVKDTLGADGALVHLADLPTETRSVVGPPFPGEPLTSRSSVLVRRHLGPMRPAGRGGLVPGAPG